MEAGGILLNHFGFSVPGRSDAELRPRLQVHLSLKPDK